jgi:hypothetical protein
VQVDEHASAQEQALQQVGRVDAAHVAQRQAGAPGRGDEAAAARLAQVVHQAHQRQIAAHGLEAWREQGRCDRDAARQRFGMAASEAQVLEVGAAVVDDEVAAAQFGFAREAHEIVAVAFGQRDAAGLCALRVASAGPYQSVFPLQADQERACRVGRRRRTLQHRVQRPVAAA